MFSGIVETIGTIKELTMAQDCLRVKIQPHSAFSDIKIGDSIAVNGTCLTVTACDETFDVAIVPETLRLTNLGHLAVGDLVNLERSVSFSDRISGHHVQGHIDDTGDIIELQPDGAGALLLKINIPKRLAKYIMNKGYIALDGMSITIIEAGSDWFTITLIPHTQQVTIAKQYRIGSKINIEVDILGKYVERLLIGHREAAL